MNPPEKSCPAVRVTIGRLAVSLPAGMSPDRFARALEARLARIGPVDPQGGGRIDRLVLRPIRARPGERAESLAGRVAEAAARALREGGR